MPVSLYDVLGVPATATPEEIRKAYRRRALQTHPDRLGPNPTPEQKQQAEDRFRKVNAAYEVLNDPENRNLYDRHGVWPPPDPAATAQPSQRPRHQSFGGSSANRSSRSRRATQPEPATAGMHDPFAAPGGGYHRDFPFAFTDPYDLFRRIFGDAHAAFASDPLFAREPFLVPPGSVGGLFEDPFARADRIFQNTFNDAFAAQGGTDVVFARAQARSYASGGGRTTSESFQKTMLNGRIETLHERRDDRGNHYVTRTTPDGKTRHWVNGKEQPELDAPHPPQVAAPGSTPYPTTMAAPPGSTPYPTQPPPPPPSTRGQRPTPPLPHHRDRIPGPPPPIPRHRSPPIVPPPPPAPARHRSHSVAAQPPPPPPPPQSSRHRSSLPPPQPSPSYPYYPDYARHARPPYPPAVPDPRAPQYADERQDKKPFWSRSWRR